MVQLIAHPSTEHDFSEVLDHYFPGRLRPYHNGRACYSEQVSGSTLVVEFLKFVGAQVVFGIPGGNSLPLNDALTHGHVDGAFRYLLTGHEQGAAFEAEGYAAASGAVGFCTATSGPGATNLVTGLADAFRDSRPVVALTGNSPTTAETEAFQALDIVAITDGKATKGSFRPGSPAEVQETLVRAYHLAVTGRPGSVLVDLPKDVQAGLTRMQPWEGLIDRFRWQGPPAPPDDIQTIARRLLTAERPLLYIGHGAVIGDAAAEIRELSDALQLPVASTVHAMGILSADDPRNLGMIGMHGTVVANLAAYRADTLLVLGARFDDRVVGARPSHFAPHAYVVHVDADARQLNRVRSVDLAINADVKDVARAILTAITTMCQRPDSIARGTWLRELAEIRQAMPIASYDRPDSDALSHEVVYQTINTSLAERGVTDVVATFDVGTNQMKGAQWFPVSRPRSFVTSGGMGSMGCAVPMATGAALARPDAVVLAAVGDGGFVMSSHELDTIGGYGLPVKIVVFDDAHLGMVTNWHSLFFAGRKLTSDRRRDRPRSPIDVDAFKRSFGEKLAEANTVDDLANLLSQATQRLANDEWPAFALTAASYGIPSERVHHKSQLRAAVERMLDTPGPYLLHVELVEQSQVFPLMPPGATPQDLIWRETEPGSGEVIRVRDRYDYEAGRLRDAADS